MNFVASIADPTDTNTQRIDVFCVPVAWQVNLEARTVEFKIRCWRSEAAKHAKRQPVLNVPIVFTPDNRSDPVLSAVTTGDWGTVCSVLRERLEDQF